MAPAFRRWPGCGPASIRHSDGAGIRVKIRDEGFVRNKAVYITLGIQPDVTKEVLGIWIEQTEGAKFWMRVMTELKNPRHRRYPDRRRGRAEGLSRCDHRHFPQDGRANRHRSSDPRFDVVCLLEGPQGRRPGTEGRLSCRRREGRVRGTQRLRGQRMGPKIPADRAELAPGLGARGPVLYLPRSRPTDHIHHEGLRGFELQAQAERQNPRPFPE